MTSPISCMFLSWSFKVFFSSSLLIWFRFSTLSITYTLSSSPDILSSACSHLKLWDFHLNFQVGILEFSSFIFIELEAVKLLSFIFSHVLVFFSITQMLIVIFLEFNEVILQVFFKYLYSVFMCFIEYLFYVYRE